MTHSPTMDNWKVVSSDEKFVYKNCKHLFHQWSSKVDLRNVYIILEKKIGEIIIFTWDMVSSSGSSWGSAQSTIISQLQTLIRPVSNLRLARLAALWDSYSRKQNPLQRNIGEFKTRCWRFEKYSSTEYFLWKSAICYDANKGHASLLTERRLLWYQEIR